MANKIIKRKENYDQAMKILGTTNIFYTLFLFIKWVLNPQKNILLAKRLVSEAKTDKRLGSIYPKAIAIGYLNEFYSKYLLFGKSNEYAVTLNEQIDNKKQSTDKIVNTLIELRNARKEIKEILGKVSKNNQSDQILKSQRSFGVSRGIVKGNILNITSTKQKIPKNCIGVFPTSGTKYTTQFVKCKGIIFLNGAVTAHGAILAREYKIPAIVSNNLSIPDGKKVILNGITGKIDMEIDTTN